MALFTRATLAAVGGALAIGALGVTGVAYAESGSDTPSYVTTVQDDGTAATRDAAPAEGDRDCPEKSGSGSSGSEGSDGSGTAEGSGSAAGDA